MQFRDLGPLVVETDHVERTPGGTRPAVILAVLLANANRRVSTDALIDAVTTGRIRGAVLDVYDGELAGRPPRPELAELPQILLTPHISGNGDTNVAEPLRRLFAENLRRYLDGQPLRNVVDRARGY